ncbi:AAA-domain-containing protein [Roridomyces roridus]|uniref:AAA-domain-containing protein n=1 Tax=Roridomyces roridus TaxID=1738132 RepID=A0AAD7FE14_9AGAR|nr:AAA-domain-containing protein [Roridomyces roridus]
MSDGHRRLFLTLPPMAAEGIPLRRSSRRKSGSSGSEYHQDDSSHHEEMPQYEEEPPKEIITTRHGRRVVKHSYAETSGDDAPGDPAGLFDDGQEVAVHAPPSMSNSDEDDQQPRRYSTRRRTTNTLSGFIVPSDEDKPRYEMRTRVKTKRPQPNGNSTVTAPKRSTGPSQRSQRYDRRNKQENEDMYSPGTQRTSSPDTHPDSDADAEGELDNLVEPEPEEEEEEEDSRPYALRQRQKINYAIPPPLEEMPRPPPPARPAPSRKRTRTGPGWSASGAELGRWMGMGGPADDSDSDNPANGAPRTPRKPVAMGFASTPSNMGNLGLGKVGDAALADADPLGVNANVTFDEVGGLDDHIHALKEMTLLPLLYPEVFQQFRVTPPRGVLFHGPPGTGKTLLARALAASCRTNGRQITFFMRKGADILSKWVGEAERQLRLLFDEARAHQPSIIFFDEIDGLAPVRSSKQDQIHASIVATLLALMDGMDGRGSVVVIGATNRPDALDPALRRPGRFDREFYFGLPGAEARERILSIMTRGWKGWGEEDGGSERLKGLASLTKGYGGADLRALCTEASLNAVQRRYPQIYKTAERLLLKPDTIEVGLRDFMISIKKIVPAAARSSSSVAAPLPQQLTPLLGDALERVKAAISLVLPMDKKLSALEEAEFEDPGGESGALERELMMQAMSSMRVYRPRVVLYGASGMGQTFVGAAALHHLEGYHVQSLELGALLSDSTRTPEAAIVQLFVEAKRHAPAVVYIPALRGWCAAVSETARATVRAMLDTLAPSDPVLLLAVVDGHFADLPRDVRAWFGVGGGGRVELRTPTFEARNAFFAGVIKDARRPPNEFADGMPRRKRILEELPIAPPLEPRKPSAAELAVQDENDQRVIALLKYRLEPILTQLKRKFKRFTKRATEEYVFDDRVGSMDHPMQVHFEDAAIAVEAQPAPNGTINIMDEDPPQVNGHINGIAPAPAPVDPPAPPAPPRPELYDMDLEQMHMQLYKGRYLTPQDFLDDVGKMVHNAAVRQVEDPERLWKAQAMFTATQVSIHEFDPQLKVECERMAVRERARREEARLAVDKANEVIGKGKEKETDNGGGNGSGSEGGGSTGTRRSARHNGLQPELTITDPVQLERRLKRQRSEGGATDSHGSDEDGPEGREAKRSRMAAAAAAADEMGDDPLNIAPTRPAAVRFATPQPIEMMQPLDPVPQPLVIDPAIDPALSSNVDAMVVDDPPTQRPSGFDPFLLNPLPSPNAPNDPFAAGASDAGPSMPIHSLLQTPTEPPATASPTPRPKSLEPEPVPPPPIIERTPTPPLPDFIIDDELVLQLESMLCDLTISLTVEQLEQLRATCLATVWRHRTSWERNPALRELQELVQEFVDQVGVEGSEDVDIAAL